MVSWRPFRVSGPGTHRCLPLPRWQVPARTSVRPRAAPGNGHKELFRELSALGETELKQWKREHPGGVPFSFMKWLAGEDHGPLRDEAEALGSALIRLEAEAACDSMPSLPAGQGTDAGESQTPQPQPAAEPPLGLPLSPAALQALQQQAERFGADLGLSRAQAVLEILGRKRLDGEEQQGDPMAGLAAERILDVLLSVDSTLERRALVAEACSPDPPRGGMEEDEEALSTTPMLLLHAVTIRLKHAQEESSEGGGRSNAALIQALVEIRGTCAALWAAA